MVCNKSAEQTRFNVPLPNPRRAIFEVLKLLQNDFKTPIVGNIINAAGLWRKVLSLVFKNAKFLKNEKERFQPSIYPQKLQGIKAIGINFYKEEIIHHKDGLTNVK